MAFKRRYRRSYRRKTRGRFGRRARRTGFATKVRRIVSKTQETKFIEAGEENVQLYHDYGPTGSYGGILYDPWSTITKGTGVSNRVGDQIMPVGMKFKLWLANKQDRPNIQYRVIVASVKRVQGGAVVTKNNLYPLVPTVNNTLICNMDMEKVSRVYYDRVHKIEMGFSQTVTNVANPWSGREAHKTIKLWIGKRRGARAIKYNANGEIMNNGLMVWVIPYDSYGTLTTDNISSCAYTYRLYFKDA